MKNHVKSMHMKTTVLGFLALASLLGCKKEVLDGVVPNVQGMPWVCRAEAPNTVNLGLKTIKYLGYGATLDEAAVNAMNTCRQHASKPQNCRIIKNYGDCVKQ